MIPIAGQCSGRRPWDGDGVQEAHWGAPQDEPLQGVGGRGSRITQRPQPVPQVLRAGPDIPRHMSTSPDAGCPQRRPRRGPGCSLQPKASPGPTTRTPPPNPAPCSQSPHPHPASPFLRSRLPPTNMKTLSPGHHRGPRVPRVGTRAELRGQSHYPALIGGSVALITTGPVALHTRI